jgi:hypothetical protein
MSNLLVSLTSSFFGLLAALYVAYSLIKDTLFFAKLRNMSELLTMLMALNKHTKKSGKVWSYVDEFERMVDTLPDVIQFIFVDTDEHVSRSGLDRLANRFVPGMFSLHTFLLFPMLPATCIHFPLMLYFPQYLFVVMWEYYLNFCEHCVCCCCTSM